MFRYGTEELKKANMKKIVTPTKVIHMSGVQVTDLRHTRIFHDILSYVIAITYCPIAPRI